MLNLQPEMERNTHNYMADTVYKKDEHVWMNETKLILITIKVTDST